MPRPRSFPRGDSAPLRFFILSLGCAKNTVDAQGMASLLIRAGMHAVDEPERAQILIVNTCGFIASARAESLETLQQLAAGRRSRQVLIAAGCWAQREAARLLEYVPGVDAVLGTRNWNEIVPLARKLLERHERQPLSWIEEQTLCLPETVGAPGYAVQGPSAYLKISDGCSRRCAFCAIPGIKGPARSRSLEAILADARELQAMGVQEINLIAQDSTNYGADLGIKEGLAGLLEELTAAVPEIPWIRVLYAFPGYLTPRLMEVMAAHPQILPYIDIPLQHADPGMLRRMLRPPDMDEVRTTIVRLRKMLPRVAIRTTFITGFPGETEAEFQTLLDFVKEMRFDRVGVFTYSAEEGTPAAELPDDVPDEVKEARREALMLAQQNISLQTNQDWVGRKMDVLLEGQGDGMTVGRSYRDAPEIDGLVLIPGDHPLGRIVSVEITEALVYDLMGRISV